MGDDIEWAGDEKVLLNYVKGRTAAESLALSRKATRLGEQWLARVVWSALPWRAGSSLADLTRARRLRSRMLRSCPEWERFLPS
jgi:hypothetical protein